VKRLAYDNLFKLLIIPIWHLTVCSHFTTIYKWNILHLFFTNENKIFLQVIKISDFFGEELKLLWIFWIKSEKLHLAFNKSKHLSKIKLNNKLSFSVLHISVKPIHWSLLWLYMVDRKTPGLWSCGQSWKSFILYDPFCN